MFEHFLGTYKCTQREKGRVDSVWRHTDSQTFSIGVDNGAAGAAGAAPIIWLVVVIQK